MQTVALIGYGVSVLGAFPLLASGVMFIRHHPTTVKNMTHVGFDPTQMPSLGLMKVVIAILTLVPPTPFIGVILATGWMGGAIAVHVRVRDNFVVQVIVPILIWVGFGLQHSAEMQSLLGV